MRFPVRVLAGIRDGDIDLAFRRWERARVLPGTRLRTAVGVLEVRRVDVVERSELRDDDARRAGFASRDDLLAMLDARGRANAGRSGDARRANAGRSGDARRGEESRKGDIHRIELRYAGADPRVELRGHADLSEAELGDIAGALERLDHASRHGPWTRAVLELIAARPEVRAEELAAGLGREKLPFKRDVRKLKELGLTESLNPGYRLSPRGRAVLDALKR